MRLRVVFALVTLVMTSGLTIRTPARSFIDSTNASVVDLNAAFAAGSCVSGNNLSSWLVAIDRNDGCFRFTAD